MTALRQVIKAGADCIEIGGNMATSCVGPNISSATSGSMRTRWRARSTRGAYVVYHNCGDAQLIMHLYNDMEIDMWGYLTGPPFGDVILEDALRIYSTQHDLRGILTRWSPAQRHPEQIKERVSRITREGEAAGKLDSLHSDFPFDGLPYEKHASVCRGRPRVRPVLMKVTIPLTAGALRR